MKKLRIVLVASLALARCAQPPPPPPPAVAHRVLPPRPPVTTAPDWFHRALADARRARNAHRPQGDLAGAQAAYNAVMLPACHRVAEAGPRKYQARCADLVRQAAAATPSAPDIFSCNDPHDDTGDDPARITACSD